MDMEKRESCRIDLFWAISVVLCCLTLQSQVGQCDNGSNQAVSPPPSIFEWLQPFRPIITVSKFPPVIEFIAQRVQAQFSNYIYEDLSRPPTYDQSTYKPYVESTSIALEPPPVTEGVLEEEISVNINNFSASTAEPFVIPTVSPPKIVLVEQYDLTSTANFNQSIQIEYQLRDVVKLVADINYTSNHQLPPETDSSINQTRTKYELENAVNAILQSNILKENDTRVFEKFHEINEDVAFTNYKDVTSMLNDLDNNYIANAYILRNDKPQNSNHKNVVNKSASKKNAIKMMSRKLIALTKIAKHVYVNVINLRRQ